MAHRTQTTDRSKYQKKDMKFDAPLEKLVELVKSKVQVVDNQKYENLVIGHLKTARLLDGKGNWNAPYLEKHETELRSKVNHEQILGLVDQMASGIMENSYLRQALAELEKTQYPKLIKVFEKEADEVLPIILSYAFILNKVTKVMSEDVKFMEVCQELWNRERDRANVNQYLNLFEKAKLASIENPVSSIISYRRSGTVPEDFCRYLLPLNIMEASLEDLRLGNKDNAKTALILASSPPGIRANEKTGAGPTCWGPDGNSIQFHMALSKKWVDLYQTWNLAFVSHYPDYPYIIMKLLIPQVGLYSHQPSEYIYNRILALWSHMNFSFLRRADDCVAGRPKIQWSCRDLTSRWGAVNKISALDYVDKVDNADHNRLNQFQNITSHKYL